MLEKIEARIIELAQLVDQSLANHHALLGALAEAKKMIDLYNAPVTPPDPTKK